MRIISRLDVKGKNLIKGINLEGLRVVGNPNEYARSIIMKVRKLYSGYL